jgi:hypothetical protein
MENIPITGRGEPILILLFFVREVADRTMYYISLERRETQKTISW